MSPVLLVLNAGSSSVKFRVFEPVGLTCLAHGQAAHIGTTADLSIQDDTTGRAERLDLPPRADHELAIATVIDWLLRQQERWKVQAVAHRVVHGGREFSGPVQVDARVRAALEALTPLAPLHQPHNLAALDICSKYLPDLPQVACFDTAFHAAHTDLFSEFALPARSTEVGVRRYGFHGLSYEWILQRLHTEYPELAKGRVVIAHLGNGASLCALHEGKSVDSTMGMTALDGLPMGTRSGALDPGALLFLLETLGLSLTEINHLLYHEAGLLGLSGETSDVERLLNSGRPRARFALDYFALKVAQYIAQMGVSLGGIDTLVFTGGIGEHALPVRADITKRIDWLHIARVLVMPTNEEAMMAQHTRDLLAQTSRAEPHRYTHGA